MIERERERERGMCSEQWHRYKSGASYRVLYRVRERERE